MGNIREYFKAKAQSGFTVIQLVMVIIVISILFVSAAPSITPANMNLQYEASRILADIRYTQLLSKTCGQRYRLVKTAANTYQILNQSGTAMVMPQGVTTQTLTSGISFSSLTNLPNNLLAFGIDGSPYVDTGIPGTSLSGTATITLTNGSLTRNIQISPQTGYGVLA
jgi:type II secretory pathway pseudopilin PulG